MLILVVMFRDLDVIMSEEAHEMFDDYINNNETFYFLIKK